MSRVNWCLIVPMALSLGVMAFSGGMLVSRWAHPRVVVPSSTQVVRPICSGITPQERDFLNCPVSLRSI